MRTYFLIKIITILVLICSSISYAADLQLLSTHEKFKSQKESQGKTYKRLLLFYNLYNKGTNKKELLEQTKFKTLGLASRCNLHVLLNFDNPSYKWLLPEEQCMELKRVCKELPAIIHTLKKENSDAKTTDVSCNALATPGVESDKHIKEAFYELIESAWELQGENQDIKEK